MAPPWRPTGPAGDAADAGRSGAAVGWQPEDGCWDPLFFIGAAELGFDHGVETLAAPGDVDGDGLGDLAVGHSARWGEPSYLAVVSGATGRRLWALELDTQDYADCGRRQYYDTAIYLEAAGDFDGDGAGDIVFWGDRDYRVSVLSGASGALLFRHESGPRGWECCWRTGAAPAGDLDGDGRADLLVDAYETSHYVGDDGVARCARGFILGLGGPDGRELFRWPSDGLAPPWSGCAPFASVGDLDRDGVPDFAVLRTPGVGLGRFPPIPGSFFVLSGADRGVLADLDEHDVEPEDVVDAFVSADLDGDGLGDLAAMAAVGGGPGSCGGPLSACHLHALRPADETRLWGKWNVDYGIRFFHRVWLAPLPDVDGDGGQDLVVSGGPEVEREAFGLRQVLVVSGTTGELLARVSHPDPAEWIDWNHTDAVAVGDVDGDGRWDLAVAGRPAAGERSPRVWFFRGCAPAGG